MTIRDLNIVRTGASGGQPVIMLHAAGLDLTYWADYIEAFRTKYDVVAFDLPGHGRSSGQPSDWTLQRVAELTATLARSLFAHPAHFVGLSAGGMIAQKVAIEHPEVVASLTLIDTAATFSEDGRNAMRQRASSARLHGMRALVDSTLDRWFTDTTRRERPDLIDRITKSLLGDDPLIHAALWDTISELDLVEALHHVSRPALVLVGARLHVVAGASHMSPLERPGVVRDHIAAFLDDQSSSVLGE